MNDYHPDPSLKEHRCFPIRIAIIDSIPKSRTADGASSAGDRSELHDDAIGIDDGSSPSFLTGNNADKNSYNGKDGVLTNKRDTTKRGRRKSKRSYRYDENATIYASPEDLSVMNTILSDQCARDDNAFSLPDREPPRHRICEQKMNCEHHKKLLCETTLRDGSLCKLFRAGNAKEFSEYLSGSNQNSRTLWAPAILRTLSSISRRDRLVSVREVESSRDSSKEATAVSRDGRGFPTLFIPPCLAATLGLHWFHTRADRNNRLDNIDECLVLLQHVRWNSNGGDYKNNVLTKASHATIAEIGIPPIKPSLRMPIPPVSLENAQSHDEQPLSEKKRKESDDSERQLRQFFLRETKRYENHDKFSHTTSGKRTESMTTKTKPRQRLLTVGSIFATYASSCRSDVRFYKLVSVQSSNEALTQHEVAYHSDISRRASGRGNSTKAYIVSPDTHLTLLPEESQTLDSSDASTSIHPQLTLPSGLNGRTWRLPRPTIVASFITSIWDEPDGNDGSISQFDMVPNSKQRGFADFSSHIGRFLHPTAREVADAIYLQGIVYNHHLPHFNQSSPPRIIHVIGDKENHVGPCVAEAADIMGMRIFHVDGLAAFWAQCSALGTYSFSFASKQKSTLALTGGLIDKLNGLAAALEMASRSSPCVLHIHDIDRELSPISGHGADVDGRMEEERRILEVIKEITQRSLVQHMDRHCIIRENCVHDKFLSDSTVPRVVVVFSTKSALPPGPISSILQQSSITVSAPDLNYSRWLWDDDIDGTFDEISTSTIGLSADDILYLRRRFNASWNSRAGQTTVSDSVIALKSVCGVQQKSPQSPSNITPPTEILEPIIAKLRSIKSLEQSISDSQGGGSSTLPLSSSSLPNVRWEDIGGMESIRKEIMDAVELPLKYPKLFEGSRRSGILCFGPPGTGKTLVAKAVARECGIPFLSIKGPELLGSYVGESEANVRDVFAAARAAAAASTSVSKKDRPNGGYAGASVLFFDELDSLAPRRGETGHGDGVMDRVTATLLAELDSGDGASGSEAADPRKKSSAINVIVMGATNRPDLLDPSLLRPGRFDRLLYLGPAKTKEHCLQILLAQTRKFRFEGGIDRATVLRKAMETFPPTLSGADLSAVASGALMRGLTRICNKVEEEMMSINSKRGVDINSEMAVDIDDVMDLMQDEQLEPVMTVDDFVEAAKDVVPSISEQDLKNFENLQKQFATVV